MVKVNNRNTRTRCEICSEVTIKTPERPHCRRSGLLLLTSNIFTPCSSASIVNFEHIIAGGDKSLHEKSTFPVIQLHVSMCECACNKQ